MKTRPPRPAQRLLARCLPEASREAALGDLDEEFHSRRAPASGTAPGARPGRRFLRERLRLARPPRPPGPGRRRLGQDVRFALRSLAKAPAWRSSPRSRWPSARRQHAIFSIVTPSCWPAALPRARAARPALRDPRGAGARPRAALAGNFLDYRAQARSSTASPPGTRPRARCATRGRRRGHGGAVAATSSGPSAFAAGARPRLHPRRGARRDLQHRHITPAGTASPS